MKMQLTEISRIVEISTQFHEKNPSFFHGTANAFKEWTSKKFKLNDFVAQTYTLWIAFYYVYQLWAAQHAWP